MLMINSLLVSISYGFGLGYRSIYKTEIGKHYLNGTWGINEQQYEWKAGYCLFALVEVGCLLSGIVLSLLLVFLFPSKLLAYFLINGGAILSGYIYTKKSSHLLHHYKIIKCKLDS